LLGWVEVWWRRRRRRRRRKRRKRKRKKKNLGKRKMLRVGPLHPHTHHLSNVGCNGFQAWNK